MAAVGVSLELPERSCFADMMVSAEGCEVDADGSAAVLIGVAVVDVTAFGGHSASHEDADRVVLSYVFDLGLGWLTAGRLVAVGRDVVGEVFGV